MVKYSIKTKERRHRFKFEPETRSKTNHLPRHLLLTHPKIQKKKKILKAFRPKKGNLKKIRDSVRRTRCQSQTTSPTSKLVGCTSFLSIDSPPPPPPPPPSRSTCPFETGFVFSQNKNQQSRKTQIKKINKHSRICKQ